MRLSGVRIDQQGDPRAEFLAKLRLALATAKKTGTLWQVSELEKIIAEEVSEMSADVSSCTLCGSGLDSPTVGQTCGGCEVVLTAREILTR